MQVQSKKEELVARIAELEAECVQLRAMVVMLWERHISLTRALPPDLLRVSFTKDLITLGNVRYKACKLCSGVRPVGQGVACRPDKGHIWLCAFSTCAGQGAHVTLGSRSLSQPAEGELLNGNVQFFDSEPAQSQSCWQARLSRLRNRRQMCCWSAQLG